MKREHKLALTAGALAVVFTLCVAEASLVVFRIVTSRAALKKVGTLDSFVVSAAKAGAPFDPRTRLEVVTDLRNKGIDAVVPFNYLSSRDDTDHGFNNPPGLYEPGAVDVAAIGDSFTHGACLPREESLVGRIRARYPRTASFGWLANGPLLDLAALREYAEPLRPKTVLWFFVENDLDDLNKEKQVPVLLSYLKRGFSQKLLSRQGEIDSVLTRYLEAKTAEHVAAGDKGERAFSARQLILEGFRLRQLRRTLGLIRPAPVTREPNDFELFTKVLRTAKADVDSWGGKLYFVYLPGWEYLSHRDDAKFVNTYGFANADRARVLAAAAEAGLPILDPLPLFLKSADPLRYFPYRQFAHYNPAGTELVGKFVVDELARNRENMSQKAGK
ncbi:MAG: hypothetical protein HY075_02545 [Deltaproteobacteria bacterium]|nr:hypothetical protein [Deltaproteobacteria bacterium]